MLIHVFSGGRKITIKGEDLSIHTHEQDSYLRIKRRFQGRPSLEKTIALFQTWDSVVEDDHLHSSEGYEIQEDEPTGERPGRRLNIPND